MVLNILDIDFCLVHCKIQPWKISPPNIFEYIKPILLCKSVSGFSCFAQLCNTAAHILKKQCKEQSRQVPIKIIQIRIVPPQMKERTFCSDIFENQKKKKKRIKQEDILEYFEQQILNLHTNCYVLEVTSVAKQNLLLVPSETMYQELLKTALSHKNELCQN